MEETVGQKQHSNKSEIYSKAIKTPNSDVKVKERDYVFDNIKAILIYLVVIGHLINTEYAPSKIYEVIYYFIYFFHMPAFIFITGYFSKNLDKCRDTAVKNFLIPYIVIDLLSFLQECILRDKPITLTGYAIFEPKLGCWFLLAMFVWKILLKDIVKIRCSVVLIFLFGLIAGLSDQFTQFMSLGRIAAFGGFFVLGYFVDKKHVEMIRKIPKWLTIGTLMGIIWIAYYFVMYDIMPKGPLLFRKPYRDEKTDIDLTFRLILYVIAFLMIIILINLTSAKQNILSIIGQRTLTVYVIHLFFIRYLDEHPLFQDNILAYSIYIFGGGIFLTILCSRGFVIKWYNAIMNGINKLLFKP